MMVDPPPPPQNTHLQCSPASSPCRCPSFLLPQQHSTSPRLIYSTRSLRERTSKRSHSKLQKRTEGKGMRRFIQEEEREKMLQRRGTSNPASFASFQVQDRKHPDSVVRLSVNQPSLCCIHTCEGQNGQPVSSHLAVGSSEASAAGTGVLKGVLVVVGGWQGLTQAPIKAGSALAQVRVTAGAGGSWLGWGWGVQGKLERRRVDADAEPAAATGEQDHEGERRGTPANAPHRPDLRSWCSSRLPVLSST